MQDKELKEVIIVDMDGTLTNCEHRLHYIESEDKDWTSFHDNMHLDKVNQWCRRIIESFDAQGVGAVIVTGRAKSYHLKTCEWLDKNNIPYLELYMRSDEDQREDAQIKKDIFLQSVSKKWKPIFVLDDRKSVVQMWRDLGLICLQPDWGDF